VQCREAIYVSASQTAGGGVYSHRLKPSASARLDLGQRQDFTPLAKPVEIIRPRLHHQHALGPKFSVVGVSSTDGVGFLAGELALYGIRVPTAHFVQPRGRHSSKAMNAHGAIGGLGAAASLASVAAIPKLHRPARRPQIVPTPRVNLLRVKRPYKRRLPSIESSIPPRCAALKSPDQTNLSRTRPTTRGGQPTTGDASDRKQHAGRLIGFFAGQQYAQLPQLAGGVRRRDTNVVAESGVCASKTL
jgi:hypothetical protein